MKQRFLVLILMLNGSAHLQAQSYDGPDLNGDDIFDLGQVWSENGSLSMSVLLSRRAGFTEYKWVNRTGSYDQTHRWFYGDFNGDLMSDTACLRDDNGHAWEFRLNLTASPVSAKHVLQTRILTDDPVEYIMDWLNTGQGKHLTLLIK